MKILSWILLALVSLLGLVGSAESLGAAYFGDSRAEMITGTIALADLSSDEQVTKSVQGRRGTAASLGLSLTALLLCVVLGPYRRGAVWAWWAILVSTVLFGAGVLLRIPLLGTTQGSMTGLVVLLITIPALLLDVQRVYRGKKSPTETPTA